MYKLRSRIVNFRVTDEELEQLKTASAIQGASCLSDFARTIVLAVAKGALPAGSEARLVSFEHRLNALEAGLTYLRNGQEDFAQVARKG